MTPDETKGEKPAEADKAEDAALAGEPSEAEPAAGEADGGRSEIGAAAADAPAEDAPAEEPAADAPAEKPAPARRGARTPGEGVIVRAQAKYVRSSPRKARLVCDHIRGKTVAEARAILAFSPRSVAEAWEKLLESAVANAENNHDLNGEDLKIHAVYADAGPTIKRYRPRAMGRATRIRKRTSHLTIQLTPQDTSTGAKKAKGGRKK